MDRDKKEQLKKIIRESKISIDEISEILRCIMHESISPCCVKEGMLVSSVIFDKLLIKEDWLSIKDIDGLVYQLQEKVKKMKGENKNWKEE